MNAPVVDCLLQPVQGSFLSFIKENKTLAKEKAPSKIAGQIIAGARTPEIIACVCAEAIIGDFYTCGRCCGRSSIGYRTALTGTSSTSGRSTRRPTRTSTTRRNTLAW